MVPALPLLVAPLPPAAEEEGDIVTLPGPKWLVAQSAITALWWQKEQANKNSQPALTATKPQQEGHHRLTLLLLMLCPLSSPSSLLLDLSSPPADTGVTPGGGMVPGVIMLVVACGTNDVVDCGEIGACLWRGKVHRARQLLPPNKNVTPPFKTKRNNAIALRLS